MSNDVNTNPFDEGPKREENKSTNVVEFNVKNYLNTRLDKNESKREISVRVIFTKDIDGKDKVTIPVLVHNLKLSEDQNKEFKVSKNSFKSFICLDDPHIKSESNPGKCPLCAKMDELFSEANEIKKDSDQFKTICKKAYSYETKTAYIVRVIERGHEEDGVKFWRFNKHDDGTGIFDALLNNYMAYKSNGEDIFDYHTGRDIKIILSKKIDKTKSGETKEKTGVMLMVDVKQSPLSDNEDQIKAWVEDAKDWRDMYKSKAYGYLKLIADGETPIYNKSLGGFVPYRPGEKPDNEGVSLEEVKNGQPQITCQGPVSDTAMYDPERMDMNAPEDDLPF